MSKPRTRRKAEAAKEVIAAPPGGKCPICSPHPNHAVPGTLGQCNQCACVAQAVAR